MQFHKNAVLILLLWTFLWLIPAHIYASDVETTPHQVHEATHFQKAPTLKSTYYSQTFSFPYNSGRVVLSSTPDGTGPVTFYNLMSIYGNFGTGGDFSFGGDCKVMSINPIDITNFLVKPNGTDVMGFSLSYRRGSCGPPTIKIDGVRYQYADIGDLYVVHLDDSANKPEPFLIPPWDYEAGGIDLYQALARVDSYFDHQYPLLETLYIDEPPEASSSALRYDRSEPELVGVGSGHDAYSWGKRAGVTSGTPVLAAAGGTATYSYNRQYGHALFIDHGNGFQTRYTHLQKNDLVTEDSTTVTQGQQIGLVGASGGVDRPRLHLMVVRDKDGDGDFEDNIPDGLVDPFGWRSPEPDPWEHHTFTHNDETKTGTRSYYMWEGDDRLLSRSTLHEDGNRLYVNNFTMKFPRYAVTNDALVHMQLQHPLSFESFHSIGSSMQAEVYDDLGVPITSFNKYWDLIIEFDAHDIARFDSDTLSIYSRSDEEEDWLKEDTTIDLDDGEAQITINHLTEFGLFGEPLDSIPPVTTATLIGDLDSSGVYTSDIDISLEATDTPTEHTQGIDYILYKVGDTDWEEYTDTFTLSGSGTYEVSYYAVDNDGNAEETDTLTLTIDFTPLTPTATPTSTTTPTPTNTPTPTTVYSLPIVPYLSSTPTPTLTPTPTGIPDANPLPPPDLSNRRTQDFLSSESPTPTPQQGVLSVFSNNSTLGTNDSNESSRSFPWILVGGIVFLLIVGGIMWWNTRD